WVSPRSGADLVQLRLRSRDRHGRAVGLHPVHDFAGCSAAAEATAAPQEYVANLAGAHQAGELVHAENWITATEAANRHDWFSGGEDDRRRGIGVGRGHQILGGALIGDEIVDQCRAGVAAGAGAEAEAEAEAGWRRTSVGSGRRARLRP